MVESALAFSMERRASYLPPLLILLLEELSREGGEMSLRILSSSWMNFDHFIHLIRNKLKHIITQPTPSQYPHAHNWRRDIGLSTKTWYS